MDFWASAKRNTGNVEVDNAATSGLRKHGRLRCTLAQCTMGEILDLSAGGMRVKGKVKADPGTRVMVSIVTQNGPVLVECKVAWVKRVKLFWFEMGLEFGAIDPELRRVLGEFARVAAETEVLRPTVAEYIADSNREKNDRKTG
jgi:hypothetical protein